MKRRMIGALVVAVALLGATPSQGRPLAATAKVCAPPSYPGDGYFTSLHVKKVSCRAGRKVAMAYYRCRTKNGPAGKCHRRVMHFSCHEVRQSIPTELDALVTCRHGARRVSHSYQQNL
jgi:hypothetical protein